MNTERIEGESEATFVNVLSSTAIDAAGEAPARADLPETPINRRTTGDDTIANGMGDLGLASGSFEGPTVIRVPPGFNLQEDILMQQRGEAATIAHLSLIRQRQDELEREADMVLEASLAGGGAGGAATHGHTFSALRLDLENQAKEALAEVREAKIKLLNEEKEELIKKNKELLAIINVEKEEKAVGPNVEIRPDMLLKSVDGPFRRPEHEDKKGSAFYIEEGRWTISNRTMSIQTEMGEWSTLRAREKVTGESKTRRSAEEVGDDWFGRKVQKVMWDEMETRSKAAWRRRQARVRKEMEAEWDAEWAKANKTLKEFEEAADDIERIIREQEEINEKASEDASTPDQPAKTPGRLSRSERRRRAKENATGEQSSRNPKLRRTEIGDKMRKESQQGAAGETAQKTNEVPNIFGAERNGHSKNDETEPKCASGFDARQVLSQRTVEPVDDEEMQVQWVLQEKTEAERVFRLEQLIKEQRRKERDQKRQERRERNDYKDMLERKRVRYEKMRDDERKRKTEKDLRQDYYDFQSEHYDKDKIDKNENITVTSSTGNYVFYERPRERLTHEISRPKSTTSRREKIRQQDKENREEEGKKVKSVVLRKDNQDDTAEMKSAEEEEGEEEEEEDESPTQRIDEEDRAPVRRSKK